MAQTTAVGTTLQLQTQSGTKANGQAQMKVHKFAYVSPNAANDDILAVGQALAALIDEPLMQISRVDVTALSDASGGGQTSGTTGTSAGTTA
ncbi:uncharacterized protein DUF1659 [Alicyclobacillus sacchari]|uniref:Uncharacterized protein DUF1659 n=1 Tax=Alicyclobacillus sacchari TaxID=392010 RepID=A0A4R8LT91_9BACL|nr:DUF1659 domain-containing protein [Alicyclobacillus sacchari]TDY49995.1 uncharacterized protein DUF1659 [Alicyclobacillus sacchari]GMA57691.1 hypothetical protein GCM10025858_21940 [Alicyclobacillus sacchari]